ncbi:hypothetical protein CLOSTASPAR_04534 [[Clostridium] asparagiforme DSM 15981]|uniref:Uncharacterized protein n=1 Tax=[Clostridium] asparagiforme DSM 15981 TaxID=518636 RepID=C0D5I8_9FIRM|nr:hypothetical protein CLOSTASPAR_04534 [[Clostridium] asparagiforme DSM 15981]
MMITVIYNRKTGPEKGAASWLRGALSRSCFSVDSILITSGTSTGS